MEKTKDTGILVPIPPDLKEWVDAQAEDIGVNAAIWIRMLVFAARKKHFAPLIQAQIAQAIPAHTAQAIQPVEYDAAGNTIDPDAWRGPVDDDTADASIDVDAIIDSRLAEAEAAGVTAPAQQPYEAFGAPPPNVTPIGGARALRRPMPGNGLLAPPGSRIGV